MKYQFTIGDRPLNFEATGKAKAQEAATAWRDKNKPEATVTFVKKVPCRQSNLFLANLRK